MGKRHHHCDVICVPVRRRRRRRAAGATVAKINQTQRVGGGISGLINPTVQIPINLGDATAIRGGRGNSVTNIL